MRYYIGSMPVGHDDLTHSGRKGMKWGQHIFGEPPTTAGMHWGVRRAPQPRTKKNMLDWGIRRAPQPHMTKNKLKPPTTAGMHWGVRRAPQPRTKKNVSSVRNALDFIEKLFKKHA